MCTGNEWVNDNSTIKDVHVGRKGLYLNVKAKGRISLNFMHKIRKL